MNLIEIVLILAAVFYPFYYVFSAKQVKNMKKGKNYHWKMDEIFNTHFSIVCPTPLLG